jgi:hypothetical protein
MDEKPFFCDPLNSIRKSYADLMKDVRAVKSIPSVYFSQCYYDIFKIIVAAVCSDSEVTVVPDVSTDMLVGTDAFRDFS